MWRFLGLRARFGAGLPHTPQSGHSAVTKARIARLLASQRISEPNPPPKKIYSSKRKNAPTLIRVSRQFVICFMINDRLAASLCKYNSHAGKRPRLFKLKSCQ